MHAKEGAVETFHGMETARRLAFECALQCTIQEEEEQRHRAELQLLCMQHYPPINSEVVIKDLVDPSWGAIIDAIDNKKKVASLHGKIRWVRQPQEKVDLEAGVAEEKQALATLQADACSYLKQPVPDNSFCKVWHGSWDGIHAADRRNVEEFRARILREMPALPPLACLDAPSPLCSPTSPPQGPPSRLPF